MQYRIFQCDPGLKPFRRDIQLRMENYHKKKAELLNPGQLLSDFANGYLFFGFHRGQEGWYYREWAPAAEAVYLAGDFNGWERTSHPLTKKENGVWELFLPGQAALWDGCRVMTLVWNQGRELERVPLYATRVVQDPETYVWNAEICEEKPFPGPMMHLSLRKRP